MMTSAAPHLLHGEDAGGNRLINEYVSWGCVHVPDLIFPAAVMRAIPLDTLHRELDLATNEIDQLYHMVLDTRKGYEAY